MIKTWWFLGIIAFIGCSSPMTRYKDVEAKRLSELKRDVLQGDRKLLAMWKYKENLKRDYADLFDPPDAFIERIELRFSIALNEATLDTPGAFERIVARWDTANDGPAPSRERLIKATEVMRGRLKTLDDHIAKELAAAEQRFNDNVEITKTIITVVVALAVVTAVGVAAAHSGPYQYGPYQIEQPNPTTVTIWSPRRISPYYCTISGNVISNCR
jgi:hypothetical protein